MRCERPADADSWVLTTVCAVNHRVVTLTRRPASINVNHIRGGQRNYVAKANIDNWVEERFDKNYLPGKARLFERRQYDSMSTMTQREAQAAYVKNHEGRLTCKLPDPRGGKDYRSRTWTRTNLINYASPQPQNLDSKGLYWVGTAPSNMYKSVTATTHGERQKAEFQIRSFGSDGRSRMLKTMKPEHKPDAEVLSTYRAKYNGGASRWQSESAARYTSWVDIAPSLDTRLRAKESMVTDLREAGVQGAGAFN